MSLGVAAVVGISVVLLIIILVIIDVSCYFVNSCGLTMILCTRLCGQSQALGKEKAAEEGERYDSHRLSQCLFDGEFKLCQLDMMKH